MVINELAAYQPILQTPFLHFRGHFCHFRRVGRLFTVHVNNIVTRLNKAKSTGTEYLLKIKIVVGKIKRWLLFLKVSSKENASWLRCVKSE